MLIFAGKAPPEMFIAEKDWKTSVYFQQGKNYTNLETKC